MGMCQHRMACPIDSVLDQFLEDFGCVRNINVSERFFEHQRVGEIVDIFACAAKMDLLFVVTDVFFDEVFNGF